MTDSARPGRLVLAGAPIGRAADASPALRHLLAEADVIAAEDTRRLRRLAGDLDISLTARVVSYYDAVEQSRIPALLDHIAAGETVVVITDAGMPSVSDPGYRLVSAAAERGMTVTSVPGPSAVVTALALSGLPSDRFTFEGFLPRKAGERARTLAALRTEPRTMVFFESVHRLTATLEAMRDVFGGERPAALCRELTKTYEEVRRGTLDEIASGAADVRGEVTLVVAGATESESVPDAGELAALVQELVAAGATRRDAVDEIAARFGLARRVVYSAATQR